MNGEINIINQKVKQENLKILKQFQLRMKDNKKIQKANQIYGNKDIGKLQKKEINYKINYLN